MDRAAKTLAACALALMFAGLSSCMTPPASYPPLNPNGGARIGSSGGGNSALPAASAAGTVTGGTIDSAQSEALSNYLKQHRLPLVKAQVVTDSSGGREVILFGYAASDFGKADAEQKARTYMHNPSLVVDNRIVVSQSLAGTGNGNSGGPAGVNSTPDNSNPYGSSMGTAQDYSNTADVNAYNATAQPYGSYGSSSGSYGSSSSSSLMGPLLMMLLGSGASFGGGYGGFSGGFGPGYGPGYGGFGGYPGYPAYGSPYGYGYPYP